MPRQEKHVCYDSGYDSTSDDGSHYKRILSLTDDLVVQAKERRYGAEGKSGRHHECVIGPGDSFVLVKAHSREDGNNLGQHLGKKKDEEHSWRGEECRTETKEPARMK